MNPTVCLLLMSGVMRETLTSEAVVSEVSARGYLLRVGTGLLAVEDTSSTRFWRDRVRSDRVSFVLGEKVGVRIKTDSTPPMLREMADVSTWRWLSKIRGEVMPATLLSVDGKTMEVKFADDTSFSYRVGSKCEVTLKGAAAALTDLEVGQTVYVRGRLLASLDTQVVAVADAPAAIKPPERRGRTVDPERLPETGTVRGEVERVLPANRMFSVTVQSRLLYFTFTERTSFGMGGRSVGSAALRKGLSAQVAYKRDRFGRLLATKVELFQAG